MNIFAVLLICAVSRQTVQLNETANSCLAAQTKLQENIETLSDRMGNLENSLEKLRKDLNQDAFKFIVEKCMNDVSKTKPELSYNQTVCTPPCENGGQCMANNVCSCATSFFGDRCQDAVCTPPCENGGHCMTNNVCSCAASFFGDRCQHDGAECDGVGNHVEGNTKRRLLWPWMAAVIRHDGSGRHYTCDGSVIHRHFVLTSASCLTTETYGWSVELGLSDLKSGTQEYKIWAVHFHPQSNGDNRDYDFAFLETEEPISFNRFVRPVCLPPREVPEDSPFYKPESSVAAMNLGNYMRSSSFSLNPLPHISNLTIIHPDECRRKIKETNRPDYHRSPGLSLCAKFRSYTGRGTPLMQSRLANGTQTWTQVGVRSWEDRYAGLVRGPLLDRQMAWVEATIASASKQ